jgi:hypothetical protein
MASSKQVLRELSRRGLLLVQDKTLPSVVGIMTGESLRGSWWAHPEGKQIFSVLSELTEGPDVIVTKLLAGKATLVHRGLWGALLPVVASREAWQLRALSAPARRLLETVSLEGSVQSSGAAAKELSTRLLVNAGQEHTASGKHVLVLEAWHASRVSLNRRFPLRVRPSNDPRSRWELPCRLFHGTGAGAPSSDTL